MPTKEELRRKYEIREEPKQQESNVAVEEPKKAKSSASKESLRAKYEIKEEPKEQNLEMESKPFLQELKDMFTSSEEIPFEAGMSRALKATGQGAMSGGDFLYDTVRGLNIGETTQMRNGILGPSMPEPINLEEGYKNATGYEAKTLPERFLKTATQGVVGGLGFPGGAQANQLIPNLLYAAGYEGAKELGGGEFGSAASGVGATVLPTVAKAAMNPRQSVIDLITMAGKGFKQNGKQVEAAANRQGINIPATDVLENPLLQRISKAAAKKKDVGIEWADAVDKDFANVVKRTFETDPLLRQYKKETAGKKVGEIAQDTFQKANTAINKQYDIAKKSDPKFRVKPNNLVLVIEDLSKSLPPVTPETQSLHNRFNAIENQIFETVDTPVHGADLNGVPAVTGSVAKKEVKTLNLEQTMDLRAALGDLSRAVEDLTGTKTLQGRLRPALNKDLQSLETSNPDLYKRIMKLDEAKYNINEQIYGLKVMDNVRKAKQNGLTGQQVFNSVKSPEEYRAMAKVMRATPEGRKNLQDFNVSKAESIFKNTIAEANMNKFDQKTLLGMLDDPLTASWLNEIMTPQMEQNVKDLQVLSKQMVSGNAKLKAISNVSRYQQSDNEIVQLGGAVFNSLAAGEPVTTGIKILGAIFPTFAARIFTDPKFQKDLINASKAAQKNNISGYRSFMQSALQRLQNVEQSSGVDVVGQ